MTTIADDRTPVERVGTRLTDDLIDGITYDVVVVGSGMGGLSAASLLAQRGQRVLLLEQSAIIGGCVQSYERHGYRWNVGMHYIGAVHAPTTTWKLFDAVTGGAIEWEPLPSIYNRMVVGDREYAIPAGADAYRALLVEEFPDEVGAIDAYLELLHRVPRTARGYFGQKALPVDLVDPAWSEPFHEHSDRLTIDALSELTSNTELIALWTANWGDYSLPPSRSSFAMHCMLAKHYLDGASYPIGGAMAFARAVEPIVEAAGGHLVRNAGVRRILVEDGRCAGVELERGAVVRCDRVISNAGVQNTFGRLLDDEVVDQAGLGSYMDDLADSYAVVGINLGLRADAEQLGLTPANIWAHPSADYDADLRAHAADFDAPFPFTFITFPSTKDPTWDRDFPGRSVIEMYAYSEYAHFADWADSSRSTRPEAYERRKDHIRERLLADLERFVPGVRDALDVVEVSTPLSYETFLRRQRGGFMGVEASPARFRSTVLRAPTPIEGLYLSGQDVTTDGVIGALTGGAIAASSLLETDLMTEIATGAWRA